MDSSIIGGLRMDRLMKFLTARNIDVDLITHSSGQPHEIKISNYFLFEKYPRLFNFLLIPDITIGWGIKVYKYLRDKSGIVLTSSPPNGVHLSGFLSKLFRSNNYWIIDYRDPWTLNVSYQKILRSKWYFHKIYLDKCVECMFLLKADLVLFNSEIDRHNHINKYDFLKDKSIVIRNGFDVLSSNKCVSEKNVVKIVYAGSAYGIREIHHFLKILNSAQEKTTFTCDLFGNEDLKHMVSENVIYKGRVASEELPEILTNYRFGLAFMPAESKNTGRILQKVYDYIGSGLIPIVINPSLEVKQIVNKLDAGILVEDGLDNEVSRKIVSYSASLNVSFQSSLSRDIQFENLISYLEKQDAISAK